MSYVDLLRETITVQLDITEQCVRAAKSAAPGLVRYSVEAIIRNRVGPAAVVIPDDAFDWIADQVTVAVQAALDTCLEYIASLREMAQFLGSPDELRTAAESLGELHDSASQLKIRKDDLDGYNSWFDDPSQYYENALEEQMDKLSELLEPLDTLKQVLRTHADQIENYYLELTTLVLGAGAAIAGLVVAILGLIEAAAASGPGSLLGVSAATISLVEAALGAVAAALSLLQILMKSAQDSSSKLDALDATPLVWEKPDFAQIQ